LYPPAFKYKYKGAKKMKIKSNSIERWLFLLFYCYPYHFN
jgi:hypothetical protein